MYTLIADAGGTSTQWCLLSKHEAHTFETEGINPSFTPDAKIATIVQEAGNKIADLPSPGKIVFYGAGCRAAAQKERMHTFISGAFTDADITVLTDLEGAARALYGKEKGLVLILGTGANSGFYNGKILTRNVNHLGFLLGDEGSGGFLGKLWLKAWCTEQVPKELAEACSEMLKKTSEACLTELYNETHPNKYAASFVPFMANYSTQPFIQEMIAYSFDHLCQTYLLKYPTEERGKIRITGGVAIQFQKELKKAFSKHQLSVDSIVQSPMHKLITYHQSL